MRRCLPFRHDWPGDLDPDELWFEDNRMVYYCFRCGAKRIRHFIFLPSAEGNPIRTKRMLRRRRA